MFAPFKLCLGEGGMVLDEIINTYIMRHTRDQGPGAGCQWNFYDRSNAIFKMA